jgi:hypothetical protein
MTIDHFVVSRRRGRPPRAEARGRVVSVLLSDREIAQAKAAAKVNSTTFSGFIRESLVSATLECMEPLPEEDRKATR